MLNLIHRCLVRLVALLFLILVLVLLGHNLSITAICLNGSNAQMVEWLVKRSMRICQLKMHKFASYVEQYIAQDQWELGILDFCQACGMGQGDVCRAR